MADVAATLPLWSPTSGANLPAGTTTVGSGVAPNFQELQGVVRRWLANVGANIASAGTTDLGAVEGLAHTITGTTTITGFGTVSAGIWKILTFSGVLTLTYNATSMILPSAANITTAAGDTAVMLSLGSGNWKCVSFNRASGTPLVNTSPVSTFAGNFTLAATQLGATITVTAAAVCTNAAVTLGNGYWVDLINEGTGIVTFSENINGYALKLMPGDRATITSNGTVWKAGAVYKAQIGAISYFSSSMSSDNAYLSCDGTAISRTTYAMLFGVVGTTFGVGDGSTTFNLPDLRSRTIVGAAAAGAFITETIASGSISTVTGNLTIPSNTTKWISGQPVLVTTSGSLPTGFVSPMWVIRQNATTIQLASSLANAQNGVAVVPSTTGTGNLIVTFNYTARALGEVGGEESHAMSIGEMISHTHTYIDAGNAGNAIAGGVDYSNQNNLLRITNANGGNTAMNSMQPFLALNAYIKVFP